MNNRQDINLSLLTSKEEDEIIALRQKSKAILSNIYTVDECKKTLKRVLTVDIVKDVISFRRDRYNWLRAVQTHPTVTGSEIAILLFDSYFGDNDIERLQMAKIWKKILQKSESEKINNKNLALLWRQLGILEASIGEFNAAIEHFEKSSVIGQKLGDNIVVGDNYFEVGLILRNQGKYVQAWDSFINAENSALSINHYKTIVYSQGQRANLLAIQGKFDSAIDLLNESLSLWEKFETDEDKNMKHTTLHTLGRIYLQIGRAEEAKKALLESLKLKEISEERFDATIRTRSLLTDACIIMGEYSEAKEYISEEIIETSIRIGSYLYAAESLRTLSHIFYLEKDFQKSERIARRSLEIAQIANNPFIQLDSIIWILQFSYLQKKIFLMLSVLLPLISVIFRFRLNFKQIYNLFRKSQGFLILKELQ